MTGHVALILSGGGARGAYEVGVLSYLFDEFARLNRRLPRIDILCGTSVGAINACYLAAHMEDPVFGVRRLVDLWKGLSLGTMLGLDARATLRLRRLLSGGADGAGLFDVSPIIQLVQREIPWRAVARTFRRQRLRALTVSATQVATGRTAIFMQTAHGVPLPTQAPPRTILYPAHIGPQHALASAAIPLLFPPVRVDDLLYIDGGVRQNTPIAPALRLGATHVLAIGLSRDVRLAPDAPPQKEAPGASFLLGKVLNAFLLDHLDHDLDLLHRINDLLLAGERAFGGDFLERLNAASRQLGGVDYRPVRSLSLRPSEDIGRLAAQHVQGGLNGDLLLRQLLRHLDDAQTGEADLASYLLFDGRFAEQLIELGRRDAEAQRDALLEFFDHTETEPPPPSSSYPASTTLMPSLLPPPIED